MFKVYINSKNDYKIISRGNLGQIDLLNILKTIQGGLIDNARRIDKQASPHSYSKIEISDDKKTEITSGPLKCIEIATCIEELMKKYARELVGEVEELQGILKGKDLIKYLDAMILQNKAKGNVNN